MMHRSARDRLFREIAEAKPERRDHYLDQYLDYRDLATEWDADQWGLQPDDWMWEERQEMERRIATKEGKR